MLKILRVFVVLIAAILISLLGTLYAFVRLRNPSSVGVVAKMYSWMHPLVGIKLIRRPRPEFNQPAIYIGNHQNNYDMVTISSMVPPKTVTIFTK